MESILGPSKMFANPVGCSLLAVLTVAVIYPVLELGDNFPTYDDCCVRVRCSVDKRCFQLVSARQRI